MGFRRAIFTKISFYLRSAIHTPQSRSHLFRPLLGRSFSYLTPVPGGDDKINKPPSSEVVDSKLNEAYEQFGDELRYIDDIQKMCMKIGFATELVHSKLLLVFESQPTPDVLEKVEPHIDKLRELYGELACSIDPEEYYRYHHLWSKETQNMVAVLAFNHYLETEKLFLLKEVEEKLGLKPLEFCINLDDYLIGICSMTTYLPRYAASQVMAGNYDCPQKVFGFLRDIQAAFAKIRMHNSPLRKAHDRMKYDFLALDDIRGDVEVMNAVLNRIKK